MEYPHFFTINHDVPDDLTVSGCILQPGIGAVYRLGTGVRFNLREVPIYIAEQFLEEHGVRQFYLGAARPMPLGELAKELTEYGEPSGWSDAEGWPEILPEMGYTPAVRVSHMEMDGVGQEPPKKRGQFLYSHAAHHVEAWWKPVLKARRNWHFSLQDQSEHGWPILAHGFAFAINSTTCCLFDLSTLPPRRRAGYGTELLLRATRFFGKLGYSRFRVAVDLANAPALGLYAKCGFKEVGRSTVWRKEIT